MIIEELYLKNFGKFRDKRFRLHEGINLFYGENEAGKSTVAAFLRAMLFGMERQRGPAARSDSFRTYEPWGFPAYYAGSLKFRCGARHFCLNRSFAKHDKEQSLFCENDGEELSVANGDLSVLLDGMNESLYRNTVEIGPLSCAPDGSLALELKNYTANLYEAGDAEINLTAALEQLKAKRKQSEQQLKAQLQKEEQRREQLENQAAYIEKELKELGKKREQLSKRLHVEAGIDGLKINSGRVRNIVGFAVLLLAVLSGMLLRNFLGMVLLGVFFVLFLVCCLPVFFGDKYKENPQTKKLGWELERLDKEEHRLLTLLDNCRQELEEFHDNTGERRRLSKEREAYQLAIDTIYNIANDIQQEFGDRLNEEASKVLGALTAGKHDRLVIDENLNIRIHTGERLLDLYQLSSGTVQQVYFAFRMAVTTLLFPEADMPILLDDAFIQYDEPRLAAVLQWLATQKRQVILLTCQTREEVLLNHLNIPYERLM